MLVYMSEKARKENNDNGKEKKYNRNLVELKSKLRKKESDLRKLKEGSKNATAKQEEINSIVIKIEGLKKKISSLRNGMCVGSDIHSDEDFGKINRT